MATTNTPNLALTLAVPGSNEPFSTSVVNANFTAIDTEVGTQRSTDSSQNARLAVIEDLTLPTASGANVGVVPKGTTAERDAFWGTAATGADRVTLANKWPRWLNTDKGWVEQYFAQHDDPSVGTAPAKKVFGWKPAMTAGRVPIHNFSVAASNTPANVKKYGTTVELIGTSSAIVLDNVFTADFDEYEIEFEITGVTANLNVQFLLRAAGANLTTTVYNQQYIQGIAAATSAGWVGAQTQLAGPQITATEGGLMTMRITNPASTDWKRIIMQTGSGNMMQTLFAVIKSNAVHDAFVLGVNTSSYSTGCTVRVYGISNGK